VTTESDELGTLDFVSGGPISRFARALAERLGLRHSFAVRIVGFWLLTWLPLLIFACLEGRALGPSPRESLLLDFATYTRFFLAVPLLIVAERVVGPRLAIAGRQFLQGGFIRQADNAAFNRAVTRAVKSREPLSAELIILVIAFVAAWQLTAEVAFAELATWRSPFKALAAGSGISLTGLWYRVIALPVLQFFFYRWIWRLFIWCRFLWTISRLDLNLVASHADQAGGLGFLGTAHVSLGIFAFGMGAVFSSEVAFLLQYGNANIESFRVPAIAFLITIELLVFGPLLMFSPAMIRTRLDALREYGLLVLRYNRSFHEKWIDNHTTAGEQLLGTADIQSLADLGGSFEYIKNMKIVPCSLRVIVQLAVVASIPGLPLLLLVMSLQEIAGLLAGVIF